MKMLLGILFLLVPLTALSQNYQGMSEADMQKMMQQAQKVQACMQNVDQSQLKALEQRSKQFEAEVKALCAKGKRGEAQSKAISFGKQVAQNPAMKEMKKCGDQMMAMMPKTSFTELDKDYSKNHVCDNQ